MGKKPFRGRKRGVGIDFGKVKRKVGKTIAKHGNETRLENGGAVRAATLKLAQQRGLEEGRKAWRVLVGEVDGHPSATHRRRAVEALAEYAAEGEARKDGCFSECMRAMVDRVISDNEGAVRRAAAKGVVATVEAAGEGGMAPFATSLFTQLCGGLASSAAAVKDESVILVRKVVRIVPKALEGRVGQVLLEQLREIISTPNTDFDVKEEELRCLSSVLEALCPLKETGPFNRGDDIEVKEGQMLFGFRTTCLNSSTRYGSNVNRDDDRSAAATTEDKEAIRILTRAAIKFFQYCSPAELSLTGAVRVAAVTCMAEAVRCLCWLCRFVKASLMSTDVAGSRDEIGRLATQARSLEQDIAKQVMQYLPAIQPALCSSQAKAGDIAKALEDLNLSALQLLPELLWIDNYCKSFETGMFYDVDGKLFTATWEVSMVHLARKALMFGTLVELEGEEEDRKIDATSKSVLDVEKLRSVISVIRCTIGRIRADEQNLLLEAVVSRLKACGARSTEASLHLQLIGNLCEDLLVKTQDIAEQGVSSAAMKSCAKALNLLPQKLWELRTKNPNASMEWLKIYLVMTKISGFRRHFPVSHDALDIKSIKQAVQAVTSQIAPHVAMERVQEKQGSSTIILGPIFQLPPDAWKCFLGALYLVPTIPKPLIRSLALYVITSPDESNAIDSIISLFGHRACRLRVDSVLDDETHKEIETIASFLLTVLIGRVKGTALTPGTSSRSAIVCRAACKALAEWMAPETIKSSIYSRVDSELKRESSEWLRHAAQSLKSLCC